VCVSRARVRVRVCVVQHTTPVALSFSKHESVRVCLAVVKIGRWLHLAFLLTTAISFQKLFQVYTGILGDGREEVLQLV
jgi:hypothetical protein